MSYIRKLVEAEWPSPSGGSGPYRHLYVIQEGNGGPVKIGIAANASCRRVELQAGNPRAIHLRAIFVSADKNRVRTIERELHAHFAFARIVNEWFDVTPEAAITLIEERFC